MFCDETLEIPGTDADDREVYKLGSIWLMHIYDLAVKRKMTSTVQTMYFMVLKHLAPDSLVAMNECYRGVGIVKIIFPDIKQMEDWKNKALHPFATKENVITLKSVFGLLVVVLFFSCQNTTTLKCWAPT